MDCFASMQMLHKPIKKSRLSKRACSGLAGSPWWDCSCSPFQKTQPSKQLQQNRYHLNYLILRNRLNMKLQQQPKNRLKRNNLLYSSSTTNQLHLYQQTNNQRNNQRLNKRKLNSPNTFTIKPHQLMDMDHFIPTSIPLYNIPRKPSLTRFKE